jgi:O-antigen biosynthesis protein
MTAHAQGIVVVLGMHRSGTSAITRGLAALGVDLGNNLYPAAIDNPKGFWEDVDCLMLNERLLKHLGSGYDVLGLSTDLADALSTDAQWEVFVQEAVGLLRGKTRQSELYGFKDPRTSRLLPFWQEALRRADCEPRFVIAMRNPMSVAASLLTRNGIDVRKSHFLWLEHLVGALFHSRGFPRVVVDYDRFIDDPSRQLGRVARVLGLYPAPKHSGGVRALAEEFLDGRLRHTQYTLGDLKRSSDVPVDVVCLYEILQAAAEDTVELDSPDTAAVVEDLRLRLIDFAPAFHYISSLENRCVGAEPTLDEYDKQIAELRQVAAARDAEILALKQMVTDRDRQISDLARLVRARDLEVHQLQSSYSLRLGKALLWPLRKFGLLKLARRSRTFSRR